MLKRFREYIACVRDERRWWDVWSECVLSVMSLCCVMSACAVCIAEECS